MANIKRIACLALGFGSFLGLAHPAELIQDQGSDSSIISDSAAESHGTAAAMTIRVNGTTSEVPADCIATSYSSYKAIVAKCPTSILKGIKVPVNGQIALSGLKSQTVAFAGKTEFAPSPGGREPTFPLITLNSSNDCRIVGLEDSVIDGHGEDYWDGGGGNKGVKKPKTMRVEKVTNSDIEGLTILNAPVHCFAISNSNHLTLNAITIDGSLADKPCAQIPRNIKHVDVGSGKSCGHNTDAFGISNSTHIKIINSVIDNQDDCLALNSGSDITFEDCICTGGHGVSIGSIKSNKVVNGAHITNVTIRRSENGVRIKTYDDATSASVTGIHYKNIKLEDIEKFAIVIQQDYRNDGPTGKAGNNVPITNVRLENIHGTVSGSKGQALYINCGKSTCTNWKFQDIEITGGKITKGAPSGCISPPSGIAGFCK